MSAHAVLEAAAREAAHDPEFAHISRWSRYAIVAASAHATVRVVVRDGVVLLGDSYPDLETLYLRASLATWHELLSRTAPARRHDLLALVKAEDGIEIVAGRATMIRHLRTITRLIEIGRDHA